MDGIGDDLGNVKMGERNINSLSQAHFSQTFNQVTGSFIMVWGKVYSSACANWR